jgi:DNA-binding transcriptional LysR family regulator
MSMIDPSHLRYFYAVATEGNFTRAARKLFVGQPVVSQMVINLEAKMGVVLFERQKRRALLTREGQELFHSCQKIFSELSDVEKRLLKKGKAEEEGSLRFGSTEAIAATLLPKVHKAFLRQFPTSELYAASGPAYFLADLVQKNQIDFALIGYLYEPHQQLEVRTLATTTHHIVVHRDVYADRNKWKDITFLSSRRAESDLVDAQPALQKVKKLIPGISNRLATNNRAVHKTLIMEGVAVGILPLYLIRQELRSGRLVDLFPKEKMEYPIQVLQRKSYVMGTLEKWYLDSFVRSLEIK